MANYDQKKNDYSSGRVLQSLSYLSKFNTWSMYRKENISYYLCIYCYDGRWRMVIWCLERNIRNTRVLDWHKPTNSSLTVDSLPRSWVSIEQTNVQSRGLRQKCRAPGAPFISYYLKIIKVTEKLRWVLLLHATVMNMKAKPKMTSSYYCSWEWREQSLNGWE